MKEELLKKLHTAMCNDNEHQCNRLNNYIHTDEYLTAEVVQVVNEIIAEETKELQEENKRLKNIEEDYYDFLQKKNEEDWKGDNVVGCLNLRIEQKDKQIADLTLKIDRLESYCDAYNYSQRTYQEEIKELKAQIEKMKKYGKLLQDICTVMGNDPYVISVGLENRIKVLWDSSEEKAGLELVEDIENRLLEIKPQEWAEIEKWGR